MISTGLAYDICDSNTQVNTPYEISFSPGYTDSLSVH